MMRFLRWCDRNLHRYLASAILLMCMLYAVLATLPPRITFP